jgi:hypothetical protein
MTSIDLRMHLATGRGGAGRGDVTLLPARLIGAGG